MGKDKQMPAVRRLTGITWNHTRGYLPLVATAQRFSEMNPDVEIVWEKRSLQAFADAPIEKLAENFDLLIIDHPFAGYAANHPVLLSLDEYLPADYLADQATNSVGASHPSYAYGGHQWALAVDAATPVSAYRPDLLEKYGVNLPETWEDLLALAKRGLVAIPSIPLECLMHFYMLSLALGEEPFQRPGEIVSAAVGVAAIEHYKELISLCDPACLKRNPIRTYEALVGSDNLAYMSFAYGYSNYARPDYTSHPLRFTGLVKFNGRPLRTVLGGTGLAISQNCREKELAVAYAQYVGSGECQRGLYFTSGGQPGHRAAWLDPAVNAASQNFFQDTLATLDDAYLRPRYPGYIPFQEHAGAYIYDYLVEGGRPQTVLAQLNKLYRESRI
jgi:multiple sugar transport system substrate-binding protein